MEPGQASPEPLWLDNETSRLHTPPMIHKSIGVVAACLAAACVLTGCATSKPRVARELFNGRDLAGWQYVTADTAVPMEKVWSVQDGLLVCQGKPVGALISGPAVTNFKLLVEYRWMPDQKPGNSGIFSRINGAMKPLPPAIETQLQHGNAGDVLSLQGKRIASNQPRFFEINAHPLAGDIAGVRKMENFEKAPGEWNRVEIQAEGDAYTVWMNGKLCNQVQGVQVTSGPVGVQSEGGAIQFRRVSLTPMDK